MTHYESGWQGGPPVPLFYPEANRFGQKQYTTSGLRGPVFDSKGNQLRDFSPEEGWAEFFGRPRGKIERPASDALEEELMDLPQAYTGKNSFLSQILISKITNADTWILREFAPWVRYESGMEVTWDVWQFLDHMLGRTPEESVSRLLQSKTSSESTTMVRYGIALMLEHGFFNTQKGRKNYAMNINQIQNAIVETCSFGAMQAALNADVWEDDNDQYRLNQAQRSRVEIDAFFQPELDMWGVLQRSEDGAENVIARMRDTLAQRAGINPNLVMFPLGARKYVKQATSNHGYMVSGLKPGETKDLVGAALSTGERFRESRYFRQGQHRVAVDPAYRERVIGRFHQFTDWDVRDMDPAKFRISMLDKLIYNEDSDSIERFSFAENFKYTGLFTGFGIDPVPQLSKQIGRPWFAQWRSWGSYWKATSPDAYRFFKQGLLSKQVETQVAFAALVEEPSNRRVEYPGGEQLPISARVGPGGRTYGSGASGFRKNNNNKQLEHKKSIEDQVNPETVMKLIQTKFSTGVTARDMQSTAELVELLVDVDSGPPSAEGKNRLIYKLYNVIQAASSTVGNVYAYVEQELGPEILKVDLNRSLIEVKSLASIISASKLETAAGLQWPKQRTSELLAAESESPYWVHTNSSTTRTPPSVYCSVNYPKKLDYASQIFTLTSRNCVGIDLSPEVLSKLQHYHGVAEINFQGVSNTDLFAADELTRAGLLQYSISVSYVMHRFKEYANAVSLLPSGTEGLAGRESLLRECYTDIMKYTTKLHPVSKNSTDYLDCMQIAKSLPTLNCQHASAVLIDHARTIVHAIVEGVNGGLNINTFNSTVSSFKELYQGVLSGNIVQQSSTGAQVITPFTRRAKNVIVGRNNNNNSNSNNNNANAAYSYDFKDSAYNEAVNYVRAYHTELEKKSEDSTPFTDSFTVFIDSYVELYLVYKARGWLLESYKTAVKTMHSQYKKKCGSEDANHIIRSILEILFTYAEDGSEPNLQEILKSDAVNKVIEERNNIIEKIRDIHKLRIALHKQVNTVNGADDYSDYIKIAPAADRLTAKANIAMGSLINNGANFKAFKDRECAAMNLSDSYAIWLRGKSVDALTGYTYLTTHAKSELATVEGYSRGSILNDILINFLVIACNTIPEADTAFKTMVSADANSNQGPNIATDVLNHVLKGGSIQPLLTLANNRWVDLSTKHEEQINEAKKGQANPNPTFYLSRADKSTTALLLTEQLIDKTMDVLPIDGRLIEFCFKYNLLPPIGYRTVGPSCIYEMGTGFMTEGGGKCATTLFGHADFQLADDAARKLYYGHFTMYNKTVLWSRQHIVHAYNIYCRKYIGGAGTQVWDALDSLDVEDYRIGNRSCDLFVIPIHISGHVNIKQFDITGNYHPALSASKAATEFTRYHGHEIISKHWGWRNQKNPLDAAYFQDASPNMNTIVYQDHQVGYNPSTGKFENIISNKGHWGPSVYDGCGKTRSGGQGTKVLRPVSWQGGGQTIVQLAF